MTNQSLPQSAVILADVEQFFDALPEKRRRKRTRAEIDADYDTTPEVENYGPPVEPPTIIELDADALARLPALLIQLGKARSDVVAQTITLKILDLLGLELDGGE